MTRGRHPITAWAGRREYIKEIAGLSGFSTLEYLSRAFAAATSVSPTVWRERNVKNS